MLPIIFIHNQNSNYLPLSLWQARKSNPGSEVILIGDSYSAHFGFLVSHVNIKEYSKGASEFAKRFVNFSTNPHNFELICIQRWFILKEFLIRNGIESCIYLDSDILLYGDVTEDARRFSSFGMTIAGISGHSNFIKKTTTLSEFCGFLMESYKGPAEIEILKTKYARFRENHEEGGISDMTFFMEFKWLYPDKILDIGVPLQNKLYDISMNYIEYVHNGHGIKSVRKAKNGSVYLRHNTEPLIKMQTLHFQGKTKVYMKKHMFSSSLAMNVLYYSNSSILFIQKVWRKIFRK